MTMATRVTAFPMDKITMDGLAVFFGPEYMKQAHIKVDERRGIIAVVGPSRPDLRHWRNMFLGRRKPSP